MEAFIKQLLADKGLPTDLDPKVREQLERDLTDRAADMVNKRMINALNDEDLANFDTLINEHSDDADLIQKFIEEHVPNKETLAASALLEFRALYLGAEA